MAQARNLWLLFFLAPPISEGTPAAVPGLDWGPLEVGPRVFIGGLLAAGRVIEALDDPIIGWWSDPHYEPLGPPDSLRAAGHPLLRPLLCIAVDYPLGRGELR